MITVSVLKKIRSHSKYSKVTEWGKLLTIVGSGQAAVQGIALITGVIIVRLLSVQEYALYTLANTMLGTMTVLSDSGITTGVMAEGGKVWQDKGRLGKVVATGLHMRKKFAIFSLLISVPVLIYLLLKHGASLFTAILISIALIPAFLSALSDSLLEVAPKLQQDILPLQKNQIGANIGRLFLQAATLFFLPFTWIALLGNGIPRIYANVKLRKISSGYVNFNQNSDPAVQKEILKIVKRILPGAIYYCISGQINIWIISIVGNVTSIAQLGALSRLSMIINIFLILIRTVFIPRFAKLPSNNKKLLFTRFIQVQGILIAISSLILIIGWLLPNEILWLLGSNYKGLNHELLLSLASACMSLFAGITYSLNTSKGWVIHPIISIPINIATTIILVFVLNISTLNGILLLNLLASLMQFVINLYYIFHKIKTASR